MSVIVFAEIDNQKYKKSSFEAISYGKKLASEMGSECIALTLSNIDGTADLGIYGADRVVNLDAGDTFTADSTTSMVAEACKQLNASVVVLSNTYTGKSMSPGISVALGASVASNVISHPDLSNGFSVKRGVFSGKGFAHTSLKRSVKVLALTPNTFDPDNSGNAASIEELNIEGNSSKIEIIKTDKATGQVPLTEAEIVVSAGRGMKGPENWNLVEDLASKMGAATACSKPVSDMGWRPHAEHVGQTGITIKPNLYIAIGISGAIQHLAGVSSSKTIVAINKDPEAPFFKAADYGIVGDAFEVIPTLLNALDN
ncbi:MAG: electron transfer flavoprotein subunit alpha/FixB family protein [Bacteroidia bacterium]